MNNNKAQLCLPFAHELIIDNFAGGGGTSTGLEAAFGRPVDIAINHDPEALAMHAINHPYTTHLCESVWDVDPIEVTNNRPVALVWLSPDCKHFSKAKGGTPVAKHIRGLAWVGLRWVALTKPRVLALENVEEFQTWGPVIVGPDGNAYPDPKRKGKTFMSFVRQLRAHGYQVDWKELRACDNGAPTIRKRLFLIARRDGLPIVFPEPTHGLPSSREVAAGILAPYRTAAECINFDVRAETIFDRAKPLATNTQRRVAKGLWRHVLSCPNPFLVPKPPLAASVEAGDNERLLTPFLTEHANASNQRTMAIDEPMRTLCAQVKGGHFSIVAPALAPLRGTSEGHMGGHSVMQPLSTISAGGTHHAMIGANLLPVADAEDRSGNEGSWVGGKAHETMLAKVVHVGPSPTNARFVPEGKGSSGEITAAFFEQANGGFYDGDGRAADAPISTVTASGSNQRLVTAYLVKYYSSGGQWQNLESPLHTVPTKGRMGLVQTVQIPVDSLSPEHRIKARKCAALLHEQLPEQFSEKADIVMMAHAGIWWVLVDVTLRMLKARELYRAQSFPENYIINEIPDPRLLFKDGKQVPGDPRLIPRIPLSVTSQIRMCGNSVAPAQAEALIRANFRHEEAFMDPLPDRERAVIAA